jgi:hypothetical protein
MQLLIKNNRKLKLKMLKIMLYQNKWRAQKARQEIKVP